MALANSVSFQAPTDFGVEQQAADRQRQYAEMLLAKSQQPISTGSMVGNSFVPTSWTQQLSAALNGPLGQYKLNQADDKSKDIATRQRAAYADELGKFSDLSSGTAAKTIAPLTPNDDDGNPNAPAQKDAVAPNRRAALAFALGSQNPMLQGVGQKMLGSDLEMQQIKDVLNPGGASGQVGPDGQPQVSGGGIPGVDPKALALTLLGGNGAKVGAMIQEANKPIAMREGDLVKPNGQGGYGSVFQSSKMDAGFVPQRDANGQVVGASVVPGYAPGVAQLAGAKAGANAGFDMITVDTPQGPRLMTKAQAAGLSGGGQNPPQGMPPRNPAEQGMANSVGGDMGFNPATAKQELDSSIAQLAGVKDPASRQMLQQHINDVQNSLKQYAPPARPQAGQPGIALEDESAKKFGTQIASKSADAMMESRDTAKKSADTLVNIQKSRDAIKNGVFQGAGADVKLSIAKFVNANVPGVNIDPARVGETDYLKSTLGSGLLAEAKTLGSNPSNADAQRINDIVGSIGKDPLAMQKILDLRQEMAERSINNHNASVDDAESSGMKSPYNLRVKAPQKGGAAAPKFKIVGVE